MRYYLYNEEFYIAHTETRKIYKTQNKNEATGFETIDSAINLRKRASQKCHGYYILDGETGDLYKNKKRKKFPDSVRQMIYQKADGKCELCGKAIKYEEMTLDHIIPLAMNGADEAENLQCTCNMCNNFKGSILPEDFTRRVSDIFMYQMGNQYGSKFTWKIARFLLCGKI